MMANSAYYREREAFDRRRASATDIENAKSIAVRSADMWARQALRMEQSEARIALSLAAPQPPEDYLRQLSENPDRGCALLE